MAPRWARTGYFASLAVVVAVALGTTSSGQSIASAKAFFAQGTNEEVLVEGAAPLEILRGRLKTSSVGDLMIGVSLECAVWTGTMNSATKGGPKNEAKSRAAVNVTVEVDGVAATPGEVVFCDREQEVKLQFTTTDPAYVYTDTVTLELFLKTKNANHFNFYTQNPGNGVHEVVVYATGIIDDDEDGLNTTATRAAIGKRTMIIEEFNSSN